MEKIQEQPSVTILVPIYNVEKWIEKCARSAFEQTYENLEYVFVDDCSPDKSVEILQRVVADYPHRAAKVRILHQLHQPADHPINIYHPEGEYLKGLVLYVE